MSDFKEEDNRQRAREWYDKNREYILAYHKEYRKDNIEKCRESRRKSDKAYRIANKNNSYFRFKKRISPPIYRAIPMIYRKLSIEELLGCSMRECFQYIESLFYENMSWDNMHLWEIDHIKPVSWFDFSELAKQKECFHFTNLQPLWKQKNRTKGNHYRRNGKRAIETIDRILELETRIKELQKTVRALKKTIK